MDKLGADRNHASSGNNTAVASIRTKDQSLGPHNQKLAARTPSPAQDSQTPITRKDDVGVAATEKSSDSLSSSSCIGVHDVRRPWKQTIIRLGPLAGLFSMVVALASIFASLGVLVGSNKAAVENWAIQPSIYLAVCTAIANQSMRYVHLINASHLKALLSRAAAFYRLLSP